MIQNKAVHFCVLLALSVLSVAHVVFSQTESGKSADVKVNAVWVADNGDGTYINPIIFADYSDPDVIRVEDDYYMVSSSFNCTPVLPVLHSRDLVNWTIIGHVSKNLPSSIFEKPQLGKGCWAPSIRFHDGEFYVYYGDPDFGIYMSKTKNPAGPWEPLHLAKQAKGWIDPCPLWDDDGKAYLVHAWAKSRAGFNSVLTVRKMSADGKQVFNDSVNVFDGRKNHPTIEGPKFYKRNGYYYIFAPAGGVANGWQTVLRSKNIFGPYEDKIVLDQGTTSINGPHQGGWVETQGDESWFIHFQERGAYGRITHLQPMVWNNDWPVIGIDPDGDGKGEPVLTRKKPNIGVAYPAAVPQTGDEFDSTALGLQWQWHANHRDAWYSLTESEGKLRLYAIPVVEGCKNLWSVPNLLLQKLPAPQFTATIKMTLNPASVGEKAGLLVMGLSYSYIALTNREDGIHITRAICEDAEKQVSESEEEDINLRTNAVYLRVMIDSNAVCQFSYSQDGDFYTPVGKKFTAREGKWIGAKIGIFALSQAKNNSGGYADFDWFCIAKYKN